MVAVGSVADLRSGGVPRFWVDAPEAPDGWVEWVPGATLVRQEGTRALVEVEAPEADQALLQVALTTGPVREFRRDLPSLTELFRSVITEEAVR